MLGYYDETAQHALDTIANINHRGDKLLSCKPLSTVHSLELAEEAARIQNAGGEVRRLESKGQESGPLRVYKKGT